MKILQLITFSRLRGAEVFAEQLSSELATRGHDVTLASMYQPDPQIDELPRGNLVRRVELRGRRVGRIEIRVLARLLRLMDETQPDVIQANGFHGLKYASLASRIAPTRRPLLYRNISMAGEWITSSAQRMWGRWLLSPVDRVLSVSDAGACDFVTAYNFPEANVETIRRGIDIPDSVDDGLQRRRLARLAKCGTDSPLLVHVGGFTPEKNHTGLLAAFAQIQSQFSNAQLLLFGDGPLRAEVQQQLDGSRLRESVHILGNRSDARELLAGADFAAAHQPCGGHSRSGPRSGSSESGFRCHQRGWCERSDWRRPLRSACRGRRHGRIGGRRLRLAARQRYATAFGTRGFRLCRPRTRNVANRRPF